MTAQTLVPAWWVTLLMSVELLFYRNRAIVRVQQEISQAELDQYRRDSNRVMFDMRMKRWEGKFTWHVCRAVVHGLVDFKKTAFPFL